MTGQKNFADSVRIITDLKETRVSANWFGKADFVPEIVGGKSLLSDVVAAIRLVKISQQYDVVLTSSSRKGNLYCLLTTILPWFKRRVIMSDCLWYVPKGRIAWLIKSLQLRLVSFSVSKFIVWASHEVTDYSKAFSIPLGKFIYIPFHHTLEGFEFDIETGDYIFSGGDGDRDYSTFIEAVRDLNVPVIIASRRRDLEDMLLPPNVKIVPTSPEGFRKLMANSRMVVVPMEGGHLHSGGQQTFLNAMAMGKPVVVADDRGAKDYISDGVDGLIVPTSDVNLLRNAICRVINDPSFAKSLSEKGCVTGQSYSTPKSMENILDLCTVEKED